MKALAWSALLLVVALFVWVMLAVLENAASAQPQQQNAAARTTPSAVSRNLNRPVWLASTVPHSTQGATLAAPQTAAPFQPAATLSRSSSERPAPATPQTPDVAMSGASPVTPGAGPERTREESSTAPRQDPAYIALRSAIAWCESRNQPTAVNKTSGASGAWQFLDSTWEAVTGLPAPASAYPIETQRQAFDALYAAQGTRPWYSSRSCWSNR